MQGCDRMRGGTVAGMIVRCTAKLQQLVGRPAVGSDDIAAGPDDWSANLLWIQGRKCLLATHAGTLFSVFAPDVRAAELRPLSDFLVPLIHAQLAAEDLPPDALGQLDEGELIIAKTADRSILGVMNDLAFLCEILVADAGGLRHLDQAALHHRLQRNLSSTYGYRTAIDLAADHAAGRPKQK